MLIEFRICFVSFRFVILGHALVVVVAAAESVTVVVKAMDQFDRIKSSQAKRGERFCVTVIVWGCSGYVDVLTVVDFLTTSDPRPPDILREILCLEHGDGGNQSTLLR
mmetsp:Transcript_37631/g.91463  ORF Transcript_37631/g.91463 Transcript_37631/m.91463 type:complete len:108 (+) Transcript_37631:562-885(+)